MKNTFKRVFQKFKFLFSSKEEIFYENFFVHNPIWNSPNPNEDESERWKAIELLIDYIPTNSKPLRILEVGCGRGWLTNLLGQYGEAEGIDPIPAVIKYARKLFPKVVFHSGYLNKLIEINGNRGKYDLIVASEVIEHVPHESKSNFISEINTLLSLNGSIIITTPRKEALIERNDPSNQPTEDWLTEEELRALFLHHNFEERKQLRISPSYLRPSTELYQAWLFKKKS